MSTTYYSKIIIGCKIPIKDIRVTVSEAIYEKPQRYNTKTGEKSWVETVCVKEALYEYRVGTYCFEDVYDFERKYSNFISGEILTNDYYIGNFFTLDGDSGFYSPEGELSLPKLQEIFSKVTSEIEKFSIDTEEYPVKMYMLKLFR